MVQPTVRCLSQLQACTHGVSKHEWTTVISIISFTRVACQHSVSNWPFLIYDKAEPALHTRRQQPHLMTNANEQFTHNFAKHLNSSNVTFAVTDNVETICGMHRSASAPSSATLRRGRRRRCFNSLACPGAACLVRIRQFLHQVLRLPARQGTLMVVIDDAML